MEREWKKRGCKLLLWRIEEEGRDDDRGGSAMEGTQGRQATEKGDEGGSGSAATPASLETKNLVEREGDKHTTLRRQANKHEKSKSKKL